MKLLKVLFVAAIVVAIAAPTFAAVQNIKVSGSIEERAIYLNNFDLRNKTEESTTRRLAAIGTPVGSGASINEDQESFILSTVHVGVDSDLTDNVSASVLLSNQGQWGQTGAFNNVNVNKAFITLKEFFYQPLTVKVGRQDLKFGSGFIIGPGIYRDPNATFPAPRVDARMDRFTFANNAAMPISGPLGLQYTDATYYDAIRATLDLDPWTVDTIYSKITETGTAATDINLAGINVAYKFDQYDAKAEAYYFYKDDPALNSDMGLIDDVDFNVVGVNGFVNDNTVPGVGARTYNREQTHVFGMRGDIIPVENLSLTGEGAVQWGDLEDDMGPWNASTRGSGVGPLDRNILAWAITGSGNYIWKDSTYKPNFGLGVEYLSGESAGNDGKWNAWDPMFRGNSLSMIRGYQGGEQASLNAIGGNIYRTLDDNDPSGSTDAITLYVDGGLKPMADLSLKARYLHFWTAQSDSIGRTGGNNRSRNLGDEVDTVLLYDYTEDVQFDLTGGVFIPGSFYDDNNDAVTVSTAPAVIVTGGVKVAF
ncbi:MAG: hypothetical protein A3I43_01290 [Omnitrophica WOR_2 bacterium RIFCSPLOWO2_02_FULL_50_19]|nr:MAG: hypothetical protein A3I43_01290 [Omnitrophica WOR_2 bacterium RIFCSPLOWO2_02_FULL_50_19]